MSSERLVITLVRNVQIGKVKKRLAKTVGDEKALQVYIHLLDHTAEIMQQAQAHKAVYYSDFIEEADEFMVPFFHKYLQQGNNRAERVGHAFLKGFSRNFQKIIFIHTDYYTLEAENLHQAFDALEKYDVVLGPSLQGNCYLVGMKQYHKNLFQHKEWNGNNLLVDLMLDLKKENLSYSLLPALQGVEEEKDLPATLKKIIL